MSKITCLNCKKETKYAGNEFRPFCSERCKLIDFGAWADGDYALPAETSSLTEKDFNELEKIRTQKEG